MPATEQTWRDSKLLHVVFGVSSVIMLVATIWMLTADHQREWKDFQRAFRQVETGTAEARIAQQKTDQYSVELKKREDALTETQEVVPPADKVAEFHEIVEQARALKIAPPAGAGAGDLVKLDNARAAIASDPPEKRPEDRKRFLAETDKFINEAIFNEANLLTTKKFKAADFDVARSQYELAVGNGASEDELQKLEASVLKVREDLEKLTSNVQEATTYRKNLQFVVAAITADETKARKALDEQKGQLTRLENALYERADNFGKQLLAMPIIDAFGRPLKVEQIWLPKLTINNNFRDVARFDRCTTCHQAIDKTAPGSAVDPGYRKQQLVELTIPTPTEKVEEELAKKGNAEIVRKLYGLQLADRGLLHESDATVSVVVPESPAAKGGLMVGDVLQTIGGGPVVDRNSALEFLSSSEVRNGRPQTIGVLRGLPNPYASHPRLDLFVGSMSPHTLQGIGCTICHEGQGSATQFKFASHTPDDPGQAEKWMHEYGWFNNHHWIFPMAPHRFAESTCLKCHHEVVELEPSSRYPDPPAPQLMAGYDTIRKFGCFGCHEINGYDGPNRRIGPDLRAEPNYSAAAQALLAVGKLDDAQKDMAEELAFHPDNEKARRGLLQSLRLGLAKDGAASGPTKKLADLLEDVESPGKLRKVGPGLRHVASKVDYEWLYSWIRKPSDFRPTTRMPQFFGLTDHMDGVGLKDSLEFEPLEIRATAEFLLAKSQPFEYADQPKGVTEQASAERGKQLFETRGCLACHQHADFPAGKMNQGPDLSRIGAKLNRPGNKNGGRWLYSWLKNPSNYHPRTLMPNLILDPIKSAEGGVSDPAADIAVFLLGSQQDWKPENVPGRR